MPIKLYARSSGTVVLLFDAQLILCAIEYDSTALVPAYHPALFDKVVPPTPEGSDRTVVFIVCGGFKVSLKEAAEYQQQCDSKPKGAGETWTVKHDDGSLFTFGK